MSTKTGVAPTSGIAVALAMNVNEGTITSSPSPIPSNLSAAQSEEDPFWHGAADRAPQCSAKANPNRLPLSPLTQLRESNVSMAAFRISSSHEGRAVGILCMTRRKGSPP